MVLSMALLPSCSGTTAFESGDAGIGGVAGAGAGTGGKGSGFGGTSATGGSNTVGAGGAVICCNGMPLCGAGDTLIASPDACPAGTQCYSISLCCTQIWCAKASSVCNVSTDYNLHYVGTSSAQCQTIKFVCPTNTTMFSNACGCGCQQSASCPEYVDCMPGPSTPNSLCSDNTCPYTTRAM
jgi:hypothetical protein